MEPTRYAAAACQTDVPNPVDEASPGPGERIVVAPIDVSALRHERSSRRGHHMLAHLRTEAYAAYETAQCPRAGAAPTYEGNVERIDGAKKRVMAGSV